MFIFWKIRYLDRASKELKDRLLLVETDDLEPTMKAAIELLIETSTRRRERDILHYRYLFTEGDEAAFKEKAVTASRSEGVCLIEYFEDEEGNEITLNEIARVQTGNPNMCVFPSGAKQHDIDYMMSDRRPVSVEETTLASNDIRLLGYFCRDYAELNGSAFIEEGPGTIKTCGDAEPVLETAVSDDEIRSFVTIFRRLYMAREEANFNKAVNVTVSALGSHPLAKWVDGVRNEYKNQLEAIVDLRPFIRPDQCSFTSKRLIDVFLYTQYAHQPDAKRERQYKECLAEIGGKRGLFAWTFLTEMWRLSLLLRSAGRSIEWWFRRYCEHHKVAADIVASLNDENPGVGSQEKDVEKRARVFREKTDDLATAIWKQKGCPPGGPTQFLLEAEEQLRRVLGKDES